MQLLILFILIITIISSIKREETDKRNQMMEEYRQSRLRRSCEGNKRILDEIGEKQFIQYFGKEQYDKVIAGTDIGIVVMLPEYKRM